MITNKYRTEYRGYRGISFLTGEWIYGSLAYYHPGLCQIMPQGSWHWETVDPNTVGKYIGLTAAKSYRGTDPEDRLIYEGDIFTADFYPFKRKGKPNYHGIVRWDDENLLWVYEMRCVNPDCRGISNGTRESFCGRCWDSIEILGTVHTHPELFERGTYK